MANLTESGYLAQPETKRLCERWANRITLVQEKYFNGNDMGLERKAALAKQLENTQKFIKYQLSEGIQSSDIGQYKRFALDMVTAVVSNLIAPEIVSVQPIDNRVGMINYIKYIYGSTKGRTNAGDVFADARNMYASDPNYTSKLVDGEGVTLDAAKTAAKLKWAPVVAGTLVFVGDAEYKDNGNGGLVDADGNSVGTVNYETGDITLTAAATAQVAVATYQYNNEFIPANDIPEIKLAIESLPITAKARRLKAYYSFEAAYELNKEYGTDIQTQLNSQAAAEISHEIDIEICNDLLAGAGAGAALTWSKVVPVGVSKMDHYDSFAITIEEGNAKIHQATRRVSGNFIVCGTQAAVIIKANRQFVSANPSDVTGPYFAGTLNGSKVFVNPEYDQYAFLIGYKGDNLLNAGYVYAPYMPIMTTDLVQLEDMAGRKGWATMYGKLMLNDKFYIAGKITA